MEFYLSPESERAIMQARDQRQRQFAALSSQVNEQSATRLLHASSHLPTASSELLQAYAMTPEMTDEQLEQLAMQEERVHARQSRSLIGKAGDAFHAGWFGVYNQVVKPTVRTAFLAVDTLAQEVVQRPATAAMSLATGDAQSFGQAYRDYGNSPGVVAATQAARGEGFDIGEGLLLGGRAAEESERQRRLTIKGARADMGTGMAALSVANVGLAPGDKAFDTSASAYQFFADVALDPTAWATSGATGAIRASKGIVGGHRTLGSAARAVSPKMGNEARAAADAAGLVSNARRSTVLTEKAEHLFKNPKLLEQLAGANEYEIARRFRLDRMGARKEGLRELILDLGGASTPERVSDVLIDAVQRGHIRERGFYSGSGQYLRNPKEMWRDWRIDKGLPEMRYGGINPARTVSAAQPMDAASEIDNMLRLAKVPEADRMAIFNRSIRAENNDQLMHIVDDAARAVGRRMEDIGVKAEDVDALLKARRNEMNAIRSYLLDESGQQAMPPWKKKPTVKIEGLDQEVAVPSASLLTHLNDSAVALFDPQDLRRATAKLSGVRAVYQSAGWEMGEHVVRAANRWAFKFPTLFTRAAYTVRNNLDNLARVSGAGFDSIFNNPRAWMAMGVGGRGKFRDVVIDGSRTLRPGGEFRLADGAYGRIDDIVDGFATGTMHQPGRPDKAFRMAVDEMQPQVTSTARGFDEVAYETGTLTANASGMWDTHAGRKLGAYRTYTNGVDDEFVTAWRGELGKHLNNEVSRAVADTGRWASRDDLVDHLIDSGAIAKMKAFGAEATEFFFPQRGGTPSRQAVSDYIDFVEDSIQTLTGGNQQLRAMLHSGNLNGVRFNDLRKNKRINQILREQYLPTAAPQQVSGSVMLRDGSRAKDQWAHFTQSWVDLMASRPENHFTRFPLMAQVFADDVARAMPSLADDAARMKLVQAMSDAGFDDKHFARIAQAAQDAAGQQGVVTRIEDVIDAAKLHSADQTLNIAFDATKRSSFQEAFDAYTPFWDAFLEVGGSWGRIMRDNPNVFVRGFNGYDSMRSSGQFYVDEHGQEVFAYPGGGLLAKALGIDAGKPALEGRVTGLNLIVQGIGPGFGPMVSWGVGAFLPDEPDNQWIRDIVTPFGSRIEKPSDLADPGKIGVDLMPAWLQKSFNAWSEGDIDEHAWNSAVGDVMTVLATSGDYDMSDPDQQQQLMKDAERGARWTMFLRSAIQWGAPTGPGVAWEVETDPDGTHHRIATMAGAYFEILEEVDGDHQSATVQFIEMYGVEPFWISQGKTRQLTRGPRTREGWDWMGRNKEFAEKHSNVAGYFVPAEDPSAPPDYNVWQQRLRSGEI
ncbi:MAG TPA: hypothetical protein VIG24_05240, partial [Acidimicrobiia bacterium]